MAMTKRELIQFMDELVELASKENKTRAILVKEKFISDFEKSYEYEKEVQTEVSYLPPYYIAAMPDDVQEEIKQKVIAALTEHGECTPENIENAMCSKIYDLEDLIDIREYVERMEEEQRKKQEQSGGRQMIGIGILTALVGLVFYALIRSAGMADRKLEEIQRLTAEREAGGSSGN